MVRFTALLACLLVGIGCQSGGSTAGSSFSPFGTTRVPPPSTGAAGQPGSYYPGGAASSLTGTNAGDSADRRVAAANSSSGWSNSESRPSATIRNTQNGGSTSATEANPGDPPAELENRTLAPSDGAQKQGNVGEVELTDLPRPRVRVPTTNSVRIINDSAVTPASATTPITKSDSAGWVAPASANSR